MKRKFKSLALCLELREAVFFRTIPRHPNIVPALEFCFDPLSEKFHICMEYMDCDLYQFMKARNHQYPDTSSVQSVLLQIMQGLEHIHSHHFFHRDIKPENILMSTSAWEHPDPDPNLENSISRSSDLSTPTLQTYTIKIADFGLARETHSTAQYTTYVSTRWYPAPEVL